MSARSLTRCLLLFCNPNTLAFLHQTDFNKSIQGYGFLSALTAFPGLGISQVGPAMTSKSLPAYSQGSRAMKCAPKAGWILVGFGVAISLLLAIFVLALANSNRKVWGFSGSKRMPCHRKKHRNLSEVRFPVQAQAVSIHEATRETRPSCYSHMLRFLSPHCNTQAPTCLYFYV